MSADVPCLRDNPLCLINPATGTTLRLPRGSWQQSIGVGPPVKAKQLHSTFLGRSQLRIIIPGMCLFVSHCQFTTLADGMGFVNREVEVGTTPTSPAAACWLITLLPCPQVAGSRHTLAIDADGQVPSCTPLLVSL